MNTYRPDITTSYLAAAVPPPDLSDPRWVLREVGTRIQKNDWMSRYKRPKEKFGEWAHGAAGQPVDAGGVYAGVYYWDASRANMSDMFAVTLPTEVKPNAVTFNATGWIDAALFVAKEYPLATKLERLPK